MGVDVSKVNVAFEGKPAKPKVELNVQVHKSPEVVKILIPESLDFRDAAKFCEARAKEDEAETAFNQDYHCLPWGGAWATEQVLNRTYSATCAGAAEISVPSAKGNRTVRWGTWTVAGIGAVITDYVNTRHGMMFRLVVKCPRKLRELATRILEEVRVEVAKRELYAGAAIKLEPNENGELVVQSPPDVEVVPYVAIEDLILEEGMERAVHAELFNFITNNEQVRKFGLPTKRGVLMGGRPGTGKTLAARIAARLAIEKLWAVFYLPDARAFEAALRIARNYAPAVLIVEDIDRKLTTDRDALSDRILNGLDGLSRDESLVVICTTNKPEALPAPMLRPGRMDTIMLFHAPDAGAASRLLAKYLGKDGELLELGLAGDACRGLLPASIREVAARAKLHAIAHSDGSVTDDDVLSAANAVRGQQALLEASERVEKELPAMRVVVDDAGHHEAPQPNDPLGTRRRGAALTPAVMAEGARRAVTTAAGSKSDD